MGNSQTTKRDAQISRNGDGAISSTTSPRSSRQPEPPQSLPEPVTFKKHHGSGKVSTKEKYALIPDNFTSIEQVCSAYSCCFSVQLLDLFSLWFSLSNS